MSDIFISYGTDMRKMTLELMETAEISKQLKPQSRVCIKPNLVVARAASGGATTHPEIVEGIIQYLSDCGVSDVSVAEGSWIGDSTKRAWNACGYSELARRYDVRLIDTKDDVIETRSHGGVDIGLCKSVLSTDYLINVPVLKGHCQTKMTCCLKNLKGCIPDSEKRRFHTLGLHSPIAALAALIKPNLHIVDNICGDISFEEGGNPVETNRILLGFDPVLLDSYGARLIGYEPDEITYLRYARDNGTGRYADGSTTITELNAENKPKAGALKSGSARRLNAVIDEDSACSACYAALVCALNKTGARGINETIRIGQGFKGKSMKGVGIGACSSGCAKSLSGCPPKASDIVDFLNAL